MVSAFGPDSYQYTRNRSSPVASSASARRAVNGGREPRLVTWASETSPCLGGLWIRRSYDAVFNTGHHKI